jgi:hypothetical protein
MGPIVNQPLPPRTRSIVAANCQRNDAPRIGFTIVLTLERPSGAISPNFMP